MQCSEPSSPSVLEVGPDGPHRGGPSFFESMDDYGKWSWDRTPYGALQGPAESSYLDLPWRIFRNFKLIISSRGYAAFV